MRICLFVVLGLIVPGPGLAAEQYERIRRPPPSAAEADRIASDTAMNDSLLQKGDIVVTDRGYFVFLGVAADGISSVFAPVPNPIRSERPRR